MSQENVEIVRGLYPIWNSGESGFDFLASDVEWDVSRWAPDAPEVALGIDATRELLRRLLGMWDELRFEPERFIDLGDDVVVRVTVHTRGKGSGVPLTVHVAHAFTLRDGLVTRHVLYPDLAEALEAAGLSQ
jgi:ketosteroid isomerase-like protein